MKKKVNVVWASFVFYGGECCEREREFESEKPPHPTASPFRVSFEGLSFLTYFKMYPRSFNSS